MRRIKEIASREIITRGRTKAYKTTTIVLLGLVVVGVLIAAFVGGDDDDERREVTVGVAEVSDDITALITDPNRSELEVEIVRFNGSEADDLVGDGEVDVFIDGTSVPPTLVWDQSPDFELQFVIATAFSQQEVLANAEAAGVSQAQLAAVFTQADLGERLVDEETEEDGVKFVVSMVGIMLTLMAIQIYGQQMMMAVVEEKANRIVEVLLAHVRPRELLGGKLIGFGVLAILQIFIVLVGVFIGLSLTDVVDVPVSALAALPIIFVTFIGGFALYSSLFGLLGSLVSRQEDAQQVIAPAMIPIFAGYFIAIQALTNSGSMLTRVTSIIPFTSPFVLPVAVANGEAPPWMIALSIVLLAITVWLVVRAAAKIYEFTLLHTGTRLKFREAFGFLRNKSVLNVS